MRGLMVVHGVLHIVWERRYPFVENHGHISLSLGPSQFILIRMAYRVRKMDHDQTLYIMAGL
jgi:hypothetical protein